MAVFKMSADMGGGGTAKPTGPANPHRAAALKDAIRVQAGPVAGAKLGGVKPLQNFGRNDAVIKQGDVAAAKKAKALGSALQKAKQKYIYSSGNLRSQLNREDRRRNPMIEA